MIERFEDIRAWQKARALTAAVYRQANKRPMSRDFTFRNQVCSAALSITSNIAEGYERNNLPELINFLRYSKASCAEVKSDMYVALDIGYINEEELSEFVQQADDVSRDIRRLSQSLEKKLGTRHSAPGTQKNVSRKP